LVWKIKTQKKKQRKEETRMLNADREQVASALMSLGHDVNRKWQFAARDERTASAYINANGTIHDFGSAFHGDLADFLQEYKGFSSSLALQEARRLLGLPITLDFKDFDRDNSEKKTGSIPEYYLAGFAGERRSNFKRYAQLLKGLLPSVKSLDKRKELALKYEIGYSEKADRLIMPIRDEKRRIVTLWKYNPTFSPDRKLRYTRDRARYAFNLADLKAYAKEPRKRVVWICEGEKDVLNAIANGYAAVTPGSASSVFAKEHLALFKHFRIVIAGDYDEAGINFNSRITAQLEGIAAHIETINWSLLVSDPKKGYDLTDYLSYKSKL
jgi:DNA primase